MTDKPAPLSPTLVQEFVGQAHGNFERIKELIEQEGALVNAAWDWGGGDWETGLGAAAHMGRRDIALYLLEHGARIDLFAAAMLGQLAVVQTVLAVNPNAKNVLGPHGISLVTHAKAGGAEADDVLKFLETL